MFRLKAEIFDKLGITTDTCNYDFVEKLAKDRRVIVFDRTSQIRGLLNYGIEFEEIKDNSPATVLDKVHKHVKNNRMDMIFGNINLVVPSEDTAVSSHRSLRGEIDRGLSEMNERIRDIYRDASEDTLFMVSTFSPDRPYKLSVRLDCVYDYTNINTSSSIKQHHIDDRGEKEVHNLSNSVYLFIK